MSGVSVTNWSRKYTPGNPFQEGQQEDQSYAGRMMLENIFFCVPRKAEVAQVVPGRLRPEIFLMFRNYNGDRSLAKRTGRLYPRRNPWYSLSEAESTSGHMVLWGVPREKSPMTSPGIDPGTVRLVAQHLNHYATPGPRKDIQKSKVPNWKTLVQDRRRWKKLVEEAKTLHKEL